MAGKVFENISNHVEQALARLPQQYKDAPSGGWDKLIEAFVKPAQTLENIMQDMLEQRGLTTAVGVNLDRLGQWVGELRLGRTDADYLIGIYGKISENNSDGTAKDIILSLKRFVTADKYEYLDTTNGKFKIVLTNPVYPVDPRLYGSIDATKCAGVGYVEFTTTPDDYFGFANDPDAKGFSEYTPVWLPFYLVDETLTTPEEVGVYESGGDYTLKLAMKDGADATDVGDQLTNDYEDTTDGTMRIFDANGIVWDIIPISLTTLTQSVVSGTRVMELALTSSAGTTEHCDIYRNGVVTSMADFLTLFAPLNRTASPVFNQPLIVRSYIDDNSQAGHYGTLLLKP